MSTALNEIGGMLIVLFAGLSFHALVNESKWAGWTGLGCLTAAVGCLVVANA